MSLLPLGNGGGRIKTKIFRKDLFVMVNSQLKTPEGLTPSEYLE
jgi:hypothetical protein